MQKITVRFPILKKLFGRKRAIGPVIDVLFLIGVFLAAIAATLVIIYPNLQTADDQTVINEALTSLNILDDTTRSLLTQAEGTSKIASIRGTEGFVMADNSSTFTIIPFMNGTDMTPYITTYPFHRLVISEEISSGLIPAATHFYMRGSRSQDHFTLNDTTVKTSPWAILNASRPTAANVLNASLGYRILVTNSFYSGNYVLTELTFVQFTFQGRSQAPISANAVELEYRGKVTDKIFTNVYNGNQGNFKVTIQMDLSDASSFLEVPFEFAGSTIYWSLRVNYYDFVVKI